MAGENPSPIVTLKKENKPLDESQIGDRKFDLSGVSIDLNQDELKKTIGRLQKEVGDKYKIGNEFVTFFESLSRSLGSNPNRSILLDKVGSLNKDCTASQMEAMRKCMKTLGITNLSGTGLDQIQTSGSPTGINTEVQRIQPSSQIVSLNQPSQPGGMPTIKNAYSNLGNRTGIINEAVSKANP